MLKMGHPYRRTAPEPDGWVTEDVNYPDEKKAPPEGPKRLSTETRHPDGSITEPGYIGTDGHFTVIANGNSTRTRHPNGSVTITEPGYIGADGRFTVIANGQLTRTRTVKGPSPSVQDIRERTRDSLVARPEPRNPFRIRLK